MGLQNGYFELYLMGMILRFFQIYIALSLVIPHIYKKKT